MTESGPAAGIRTNRENENKNAVTITPVSMDTNIPPVRTNACTWVPIRTQQTMTAAIEVGRKMRNALANARRSAPNGENSTTHA